MYVCMYIYIYIMYLSLYIYIYIYVYTYTSLAKEQSTYDLTIRQTCNNHLSHTLN